MKFISTRKKSPAVSFKEAVEQGIAPDGGLYVPLKIPRINLQQFFQGTTLDENNFLEISKTVLTPFMEEDFTKIEIQRIIEEAFTFPVPLKKWDEQTYCLELFHGPTAAFKDVAAQFIAKVMSSYLLEKKTILVATSGDTGGAIAAAFDGNPHFDVVILFPKNGVSLLQKKQLTCWGKNVKSLAVEGNFDDCQRIVKELLADKKWASKFNFTSANSINIARLLPQTCYYAASSIWFKNQTQKNAQYIIPTGNMGNAVAAFWAKEMGFPIEKIIMATNENRTIPEYYKTGSFISKAGIPTVANAMDVGNPSNFERLQNLIPNLDKLKEVSAAESVSDIAIHQAIIEVYDRYKKIICPHTATAFSLLKKCTENPFIVVATADPAKFAEIILPLLKLSKLEVPGSLLSLYQKNNHCSEVEPTSGAVIAALLT